MILVDTSIWLRFLANREPFARALDDLLDRSEVMAHDHVEGELLIGDRGGRVRLLQLYQHLRRVPSVPHEDVVALVRARKLYGRGIGWVDAGLLASALVAKAPLWTADENLAVIARELGVDHENASTR